jgi:hypothetical protein
MSKLTRSSTIIVRLENAIGIFYLWRPFLPDPHDDLILELAASAGCDDIITYNTRHFRLIEQFGLRAIEPGPFLKRIGALP